MKEFFLELSDDIQFSLIIAITVVLCSTILGACLADEQRQNAKIMTACVENHEKIEDCALFNPNLSSNTKEKIVE